MQLLSASYGIQSRMSISPVDWIWSRNEGFYSSQCAQYYGSSRRFDQKGSDRQHSADQGFSDGDRPAESGRSISCWNNAPLFRTHFSLMSHGLARSRGFVR